MSETPSPVSYESYFPSDGNLGARGAREYERCDRLSNPPQAEGNPGGPGFTLRPVFETFFFFRGGTEQKI